jgi:hypothetical protein
MKTMETNTNYQVFKTIYNGLESENFSVYENGNLVYNRDYGSLTEPIETYIEHYKIWLNAPTIAMRNPNVNSVVTKVIGELKTILGDLDGETIRYIANSLGHESQLSSWQEEVKYVDEINSLKHSCENLEHRLAMVLDDCKALRSFINNNALEIFEKPSAQCNEALSHLLNIEIACDLESDECYTWKPYSNN